MSDLRRERLRFLLLVILLVITIVLVVFVRGNIGQDFVQTIQP